MPIHLPPFYRENFGFKLGDFLLQTKLEEALWYCLFLIKLLMKNRNMFVQNLGYNFDYLEKPKKKKLNFNPGQSGFFIENNRIFYWPYLVRLN